MNFTALPIRLNSTCRIRSLSSSISGRGGISMRSSICCSPARYWNTFITSSLSSRKSAGAGSIFIWFASSLERSSTSLISCSRALPEYEIEVRYSLASASGISPSRRRSEKPMTAFNGVRISWLTLAMKKLLALSAAWAFCIAFTS